MGDEATPIERAHAALLALIIHLALMDMVMDQYPEHAQEAWSERLEGIEEAARQEAGEIQQFGEAFDPPSD